MEAMFVFIHHSVGDRSIAFLTSPCSSLSSSSSSSPTRGRGGRSVRSPHGPILGAVEGVSSGQMVQPGDGRTARGPVVCASLGRVELCLGRRRPCTELLWPVHYLAYVQRGRTVRGGADERSTGYSADPICPVLNKFT